MRTSPLAALFTLAALATLRVVGAGEIYCNNQGKECSDRPWPGAIIVHTANAGEPQPASTPAQAPGKVAPAVDAAANDRLRAEAQRNAMQKDVSTVHAEQCKAAKEKYDKSIEARRLYRLGKDGEREYLSDAEVDEARLAAKQELDAACGKGG
jgi:hypothetical protein